ncbi:MAG: hypothetical protein ACFCBV_10930 [Phycisphaerales bacterium]
MASVLAVLFVFAPTITEATQTDEPPQTTVLLDFGFSGELPASQWAPVRVAISAMDEPLEAVARIRVTMPDGGSITSLVPLVTTPGRETLVPATLWIPPVITSVVVELLETDGSPVASTSYGSFAGPQSIRLPLPSPMPILLGIGSPSLRLAFGVETYQRDFIGPSEQLLKSQVALARVASAVPPSAGAAPWLPTQAVAYSGVSAVVLDGQVVRTLSPGSLSALREWVVSGGRIMLVNADNSALRAVLGEDTPAGLSIGAASNRTLPVLLGGPDTVLARSFDSSALPTGWSPLASAPELAIQGPVGLGWMMLLAFDPDTLAQANRVEAAEMAWHGTLARMNAGDLERGQRRIETSRWDVQSRGEVASRMSRDWVTRAPTVGMGAFLAIFAMMVALAFAIGPVDRIVLKRLGKLNRWWLMAMVWITLASIGAWVLPSKVRSGPTTVSSIRMIDSIDDGEGPARAWQVTADGMFLNRPARLELDDLEPGAWLSPMLDPWEAAGAGTLVMSPREGAMKPEPTTARLWTTRAFRQIGATQAPLRANVELDGDVYTLRLRGDGLDELNTVAIHTAGQWLHVLPGGSASRSGEELVVQATTADLSARPPQAFATTSGWEEGYDFWSEAIQPNPGVLHALDGAEQRSQALNALGNTASWAVVYASWDDARSSFAPDVGEEFSTLWACRMAVRVERPAPEQGGTP